MGQFTSRSADNSSAVSAVLVVLEMMSAQLDDIESDISSSIDGVCSGFSGMGQRASSALGLAASALDSSSEDGGLQAFVHRVRIALQVLLRRMESMKEFDALIKMDVLEFHDRLSLIKLLSNKISNIGLEARTIANRGDYESMSEAERSKAFGEMQRQMTVLAFGANEAGKAIGDILGGLDKSLDLTKERIDRKSDDDHQSASQTENTIRAILDKLSDTYERMTNSLSASATMSRQLNMDINQAIVSMQFQDRVSQRIGHILETINELIGDLKPFVSEANTHQTNSIIQYWIEKIAERSTMTSERLGIADELSTLKSDSPKDAVELF